MKFKSLPVTSLEDATVDFEQLQTQQTSFGTFAMGGRTAALTLTGSQIPVPLDTTVSAINGKTQDPNGLISGGFYNVPVAGYYWASAHARITTGVAGTTCAVYATLNGVAILEGDVQTNVPASSTAAWAGSVSGALGPLVAGDKIGLAVFGTGSLYLLNSWPNDNRLTLFRVA